MNYGDNGCNKEVLSCVWGSERNYNMPMAESSVALSTVMMKNIMLCL